MDVGLLEFAADANACSSASAFRRHVLDLLAAMVPYDSALFLPLTPSGAPGEAPVGVNKPLGRLRLFFDRPERHAEWSARSRAAADAQRSVYADYEVFSRRDRNRLPFYADIVRPQRIQKQLVIYLPFREQITGIIYVCRHERAIDFTAAELEWVRDLVPSVALAQVALSRQPADVIVSQSAAAIDARPAAAPAEGLRERVAALSARERQLTDMVMRGFRNAEIAAALGTSPNTVRNQLSRIFDKLGASSRTELAVWAQSIEEPAR
jgi:DNA-binding CsgD family transcriptional regulator